jgi:Ni/Co efflux regulator RcnB
MKKLALVFASLALLATPVLACPHDKAEATDNAPRTADKAKAKDADKAKAKDADKAKTAKPTEKKPDKVSSK